MFCVLHINHAASHVKQIVCKNTTFVQDYFNKNIIGSVSFYMLRLKLAILFHRAFSSLNERYTPKRALVSQVSVT